jgi:hypothetical protein
MTYTQGWPKNQNNCCRKNGLPDLRDAEKVSSPAAVQFEEDAGGRP